MTQSMRITLYAFSGLALIGFDQYVLLAVLVVLVLIIEFVVKGKY